MTTPPAIHPLVGAELARTYRIMGVLGGGGMGTVFLAYHNRLHCRVAIKMLAPRLADHQGFVERFEREAKLVAELRHPHIVSVLDFAVTDEGQPYLVMELLEGRTLASRISEVHVSPIEVARIAMEIAGGLAHAHSAGVVHRDLKPSNVFLVDAAGHPGFVKLLDFGISQRINRRASKAPRRTVQGTPAYMAPEQIRDPGSVDQRADQYSLATIAYEMLAGAPPFSGADTNELMKHVVHTPAPRIRSSRALLEPAVEVVLARALAKDPAARFTDVREFGEAFATALRADREIYASDYPSLPPTLPPPPRLGSLRPQSRSQRHDSAEPSAVLLAILDALQRAQRAMSAGDTTTAAELVERATELSERQEDERARELMSVAEDLTVKVLLGRLGGGAALLVAAGTPERLPISPSDAFLLSRLDTPISVEQLTQVSAMSVMQTLRAAIRLARMGAIVTRPETARVADRHQEAS